MKLIKALVSLLIGLIVIGGAAAAGGWFWLQNELQKAGPSADEHVFVVQPGETLSSDPYSMTPAQRGLCRQMWSGGLITGSRLFEAGMVSSQCTLAGNFCIEVRTSPWG